MAKHYEATEKEVIDPTVLPPTKVEDILDLDQIDIIVKHPTVQKLKNVLNTLEARVFDPATGNALPILKEEAVRKAFVKVVVSAKNSLAKLKEEFIDSLVGGPTPPWLKMAGVSPENFRKTLAAISKLLDTYVEKVKASKIDFTDEEKVELESINSLVLEQEGGRELATKDIEGILKAWFVGDIVKDDALRYTIEALLKEKLNALETRFIQHAVSKKESLKTGEKRWKDFYELVFDVYALTDYGIMSAKSINPIQATAKHEILFPDLEKRSLVPTDKPGAMQRNTKFNLNPITGSENLDTSEQSGPHMGIIQMICFAAYQEMKSKTSKYTRNNGFSDVLVLDLIDEICNKNAVTMWDGTVDTTYKIKNKLEKFPKEVRQLLKTIAYWKIARDDLGTQAGIWHLGRNKGAFKYFDGGNGRPAGLLSAICYQVGKNSKFENHLAATAFMTPKRTELMAAGHPNDPDIDQAIEQVDRFEIYKDPQIRGVMYDIAPGTGRPIPRHKYEPDRWFKDFPMLSQFFNQTKDVMTGSDYVKSRDAVLKMVEMAARSPLITMDIDPLQMEEKIKTTLQNFNTEIGKAIAYVKPYNDGSAFYNKGTPDATKLNPTNYVDELILAAYKYLISNILEAIPSQGEMPLADAATRVTMIDYDNRYRRAVQIIEDVINRNSTLEPYYQYFLTGKIPASLPPGSPTPPLPEGSFVRLGFRKIWRNAPRLGNDYKSWLLENVNRYKGLNYVQSVNFMNSSPHNPVNQGQGWTSSYEDPRYEKSA